MEMFHHLYLKFYLNFYDANPQDIGYSQSLYAYPISQSWVSGEGFYNDNPITTEGASWRYRDGANAETVLDEYASAGMGD